MLLTVIKAIQVPDLPIGVGSNDRTVIESLTNIDEIVKAESFAVVFSSSGVLLTQKSTFLESVRKLNVGQTARLTSSEGAAESIGRIIRTIADSGNCRTVVLVSVWQVK